MKFLNRLFTKKESVSPMDRYDTFKIDYVCPNSGPWDVLHCIYRLRPCDNPSVEIWIALPREDSIWNFMAQKSNYSLPFELPFKSSEFRKEQMYYKPIKKEIPLYIHYSL